MADRVGRHSGPAGSFDRNSSVGNGGSNISQYYLERDGQKILVTRYSLRSGNRGTRPFNSDKPDRNWSSAPLEIRGVRAEIPPIPIAVERGEKREEIIRDACNGRYFRAEKGSL